jgi:hypothetical protein
VRLRPNRGLPVYLRRTTSAPMTVLPAAEELRTSTTIYLGDDVVGRGDAGSRFGRSLTPPGASPYLRRGVPQDRVAHDQSSSRIIAAGGCRRHALTPIHRYADTPTRFRPGGFLAGNHAIRGASHGGRAHAQRWCRLWALSTDSIRSITIVALAWVIHA